MYRPTIVLKFIPPTKFGEVNHLVDHLLDEVDNWPLAQRDEHVFNKAINFSGSSDGLYPASAQGLRQTVSVTALLAAGTKCEGPLFQVVISIPPGTGTEKANRDLKIISLAVDKRLGLEGHLRFEVGHEKDRAGVSPEDTPIHSHKLVSIVGPDGKGYDTGKIIAKLDALRKELNVQLGYWPAGYEEPKRRSTYRRNVALQDDRQGLNFSAFCKNVRGAWIDSGNADEFQKNLAKLNQELRLGTFSTLVLRGTNNKSSHTLKSVLGRQITEREMLDSFLPEELLALPCDNLRRKKFTFKQNQRAARVRKTLSEFQRPGRQAVWANHVTLSGDSFKKEIRSVQRPASAAKEFQIKPAFSTSILPNANEAKPSVKKVIHSETQGPTAYGEWLNHISLIQMAELLDTGTRPTMSAFAKLPAVRGIVDAVLRDHGWRLSMARSEVERDAIQRDIDQRIKRYIEEREHQVSERKRVYQSEKGDQETFDKKVAQARAKREAERVASQRRTLENSRPPKSNTISPKRDD